jgi:hypothetical protein
VQEQDPSSLCRVRLAALRQVAAAGGTVDAFQLARAIVPIVELLVDVGREEGRWQALRSVAIGRQLRADTHARVAYGPGADAPGDEPAAIGMPACSRRPAKSPRL